MIVVGVALWTGSDYDFPSDLERNALGCRYEAVECGE